MQFISNSNSMPSLERLSKDSILSEIEIDYIYTCICHKIALSLISL